LIYYENILGYSPQSTKNRICFFGTCILLVEK